MTKDDRRSDEESPLDDIAATGTANALGEVIVTAVVTAAVLPFVQTLAEKAAEDSYTAVRDWIRRQFRGRGLQPDEPSNALLVVKDPDPDLDLSIYLGPNVSNEAIQALGSLDIDAITHKSKRGKVAKTQIYWDGAAACWRVVHKQRKRK